MTTRLGIGTLVVALAGATHASTLGLLRCTHPRAEFRSQAVAKGRFVVARDAKALAEAWRTTRLPGAPPTLDFTREMVVGLTNLPSQDDVIYRIQLDAAAAATALEVHVGPPGAPCGDDRTPAKARTHLVVTPRSDLPVHFVRDEMIDGRIYVQRGGEGVDTVELATVAGVTATTPATGAPTRELAERLAVALLTADERKRLLVGPLAHVMTRLPHGWTPLAVELDAKGSWTIGYGDVRITVDRATGKATRLTS